MSPTKLIFLAGLSGALGGPRAVASPPSRAVACSRELRAANLLDQGFLLSGVAPSLPLADCATQINALQILRAEAGLPPLVANEAKALHQDTVRRDRKKIDDDRYGPGRSLDQLYLLGETMAGDLVAGAGVKRLGTAIDPVRRPGMEVVRQFQPADLAPVPGRILTVVGEVRDHLHWKRGMASFLVVDQSGAEWVVLDPTGPVAGLSRLVPIDYSRRAGQNYLRLGEPGLVEGVDAFFWPTAVTTLELRPAGRPRHFLRGRRFGRGGRLGKAVALRDFDVSFTADGRDMNVRLVGGMRYRMTDGARGAIYLDLHSSLDWGHGLEVILAYEEREFVEGDLPRPSRTPYQKYLAIYFPKGDEKPRAEQFYEDPGTEIVYGWPGWSNLNRDLGVVTRYVVDAGYPRR